MPPCEQRENVVGFLNSVPLGHEDGLPLVVSDQFGYRNMPDFC